VTNLYYPSTRATIDVEMTPENIANIFAGMDSEMWARFFNRLGEIAKHWKNGVYGVETMLCYSVDAGHEWSLTYEGRCVMQYIGQWAAEVSTPTLDKLKREGAIQ
jgi:hypothetical protein